MLRSYLRRNASLACRMMKFPFFWRITHLEDI
jgi:hypothetical protein